MLTFCYYDWKRTNFTAEEIEYYIRGWIKQGGNPKSAKQFTGLDDLCEKFKQGLKAGDVVLVKGSRSAQMELFLEKIR